MTETYQTAPWILDDLYPEIKSPEVDAALQRIEENTGKIEKQKVGF